MNGLDLLSKVNEIHATELKIKTISGSKVDYKRSGAYTLDDLLMLNMDYFKYLTLEDGEWVLVFDYTEPHIEEPVTNDEIKVEELVVEKKSKKAKSKNPVNKPKIEDEKPNKTEVSLPNVESNSKDLFDGCMNPPELDQDEIDNVMDLFA